MKRDRSLNVISNSSKRVTEVRGYAMLVARWTLDLFLTLTTDAKAPHKFIAEILEEIFQGLSKAEGILPSTCKNLNGSLYTYFLDSIL